MYKTTPWLSTGRGALLRATYEKARHLDMIDMALKTFGQTSALAVVQAGPFLIGFWRGPPRDPDFDLLRRAQDEVAASGKPFFILSVVSHIPTDKASTDLARKRGLELLRQHEEKRITGATVILPQGIIGAFARSFTVGFNLAVRAKTPNRVFASLDDAMTWMAKHGTGVITEEEVAAHLDEVRAAGLPIRQAS